MSNMRHVASTVGQSDMTPTTRDWPEDFANENGNYSNICLWCAETFTGYKRILVCRVCARAPAMLAAAKGAEEFS